MAYYTLNIEDKLIKEDSELFKQYLLILKKGVIDLNFKNKIYKFLSKLSNHYPIVDNKNWIENTIFSWESVLKLSYEDYTEWKLYSNHLRSYILFIDRGRENAWTGSKKYVA